jgi:hypothetical protein
VETKVVRLKEPAHDEEDRKLEKLITKMHRLSVREVSYAVLCAQCVHHFPDVAKELPKPEFAQQASSSTLSHQSSVAPIPLGRQPWPRPRLLPRPPPISIAAPASMAAPFAPIQAIVFDSAQLVRNMSASAEQSSGTIVFACLVDSQFLTTAQDVDSRVVLILV